MGPSLPTVLFVSDSENSGNARARMSACGGIWDIARTRYTSACSGVCTNASNVKKVGRQVTDLDQRCSLVHSKIPRRSNKENHLHPGRDADLEIAVGPNGGTRRIQASLESRDG